MTIAIERISANEQPSRRVFSRCPLEVTAGRRSRGHTTRRRSSAFPENSTKIRRDRFNFFTFLHRRHITGIIFNSRGKRGCRASTNGFAHPRGASVRTEKPDAIDNEPSRAILSRRPRARPTGRDELPRVLGRRSVVAPSTPRFFTATYLSSRLRAGTLSPRREHPSRV